MTILAQLKKVAGMLPLLKDSLEKGGIGHILIEYKNCKIQNFYKVDKKDQHYQIKDLMK